MDNVELKNKFVDIYGGSVEGLRVFSSPGRVNLIGEHTDYNGGYVFPAAINLNSTIILRERDDRIIKLAATDLPDRVVALLDSLDGYKSLKWGNYQLGVADELQKAGYNLVGCEMLFHDTVPLGAGLSSSAAIEVATAVALVTIGNEKANILTDIDMVQIAIIAQKAENLYVGVNCGIMDQFISAVGKKDNAIILNCRDLSYRHVPIEIEGYKIVIANTNKKRSLGESKYNERRAECESGLASLKVNLPDADFLGQITMEEYEANKYLIKDDVIRKRVEHVIAEDDRVLKAVVALTHNEIAEFGRLMIASHNSLRDLYEVTGVELDTLVVESLKHEGVIGSRMTGAGFGGCTVSIVKNELIGQFIENVGKSYEQKIGYKPTFYVCNISDGGREIRSS